MTPDRYEVAIWNQALEAFPDMARSLVGHLSWIGGLAVTGNGQYLATGGFDEAVKLWDLPGRRVVAESREHEGAVYGVDFSPDGSVLVTGSADATVRVWRLADAGAAGPPQGRTPLMTMEWISKRLVELDRRGRANVLIVAQEIADNLVALGSRGLIEHALSELSPATSVGYAVSIALMQTMEVRIEQARRGGDQRTADFYTRLNSMIDRILSENIQSNSAYKAVDDYYANPAKWLEELARDREPGPDRGLS